LRKIEPSPLIFFKEREEELIPLGTVFSDTGDVNSRFIYYRTSGFTDSAADTEVCVDDWSHWGFYGAVWLPDLCP